MNDLPAKPDDPLKFLTKITKVLPRLATTNEHEKLATLTAIERLLTSAGLDWNDVTTAITDFLTNVAGVVEEPEVKPEAKPRPGFSSTTAGTTRGPGGPHRTSRTSPPPPPPRPGPPPPPPPRTWQQKAAGTATEQETVIDELLRRQLWQSPSEKRTMSRIQGVLMAGLPLDMVMRSELIKFAARI